MASSGDHDRVLEPGLCLTLPGVDADYRHQSCILLMNSLYRIQKWYREIMLENVKGPIQKIRNYKEHG